MRNMRCMFLSSVAVLDAIVCRKFIFQVINRSGTKFEAIIVNVCLFYAKFLLDALVFSHYSPSP